jgi:hypothetical protein
LYYILLKYCRNAIYFMILLNGDCMVKIGGGAYLFLYPNEGGAYLFLIFVSK